MYIPTDVFGVFFFIKLVVAQWRHIASDILVVIGLSNGLFDAKPLPKNDLLPIES